MMEEKSAILDKLKRTRELLTATVLELDDEAWETAVYSDESQSTWTIADLFRHTVDAERSMTSLMQQIQQGGSGVPDDFDLTRWNARRVEKTQHKTPTDLIKDMAINRNNLLQFINTLEPDDWQKKGRHGSMRIMTIAQICHLIADHEQSHLFEIQKTLDL